jgi:uncharacterized membrane protein YagU involved in acid resistance
MTSNDPRSQRRRDQRGMILALYIGLILGALIVGSVAAHGQEIDASPKPQKKHHRISKKAMVAIGATAAAAGLSVYLNNQTAPRHYFQIKATTPRPRPATR